MENNNEGAWTDDMSDTKTIVVPWNDPYPHRDISETITRQTVNSLITRRIGPGDLNDISRLREYIKKTMTDFADLSLLLNADGHSNAETVKKFRGSRFKYNRSEGGTNAEAVINAIIDTHNVRTEIYNERSDYGAASRSFLESKGQHEDVVKADNIRRTNNTAPTWSGDYTSGGFRK